MGLTIVMVMYSRSWFSNRQIALKILETGWRSCVACFGKGDKCRRCVPTPFFSYGHMADVDGLQG
jgi:hypothetical protein